MIKLVLTDVDNTLLDFQKCAKSSMKQGFEEIGLPFSDEMFDIFNVVNNRLWQSVETGELSKPELYRTRWNLIFKELGVSGDGEHFEEIFFSKLTESTEKIDGADDLLEYLAERYTVCAASNAGYDQQENRLKKADMLKYIRHLFVSEEIGAEKPDKVFFNACMKWFPDIKKNEIIMIGDSLTADIAGGIACGIKTCWFNPHGAKAVGFSPDYTVGRLDEIKNIL